MFEGAGYVRFGVWAGRTLSLSSGRKVAAAIGRVLASRQKSSMVRAIKANQWVVSGGSLDKKGLQERAKAVLTNSTMSLFEYFYYYHHIDEVMRSTTLSPRIEAALNDYKNNGTPLFILGPHMGSYDLFGTMLMKLGLKGIALSYPNPGKVYLAQNRIREETGLHVLPISLHAYREAKKAFKNGNSIITGLDRPIDGEDAVKYQPLFFGRAASVPTFYVRMALDIGAPLRVACAIVQPDRSYYYDCSEPIELKRYDNLNDEIVLNAEKALREAEKFIRANPEQWAMFYPVWPETMAIIDALA